MPLRKEGLLRLQLDNSSPQSSIRQKGGGIKYDRCCLNHLYRLFPDPVLPKASRRTHSYYRFGAVIRPEPHSLFDGQVSGIGESDAKLELREADGTDLSGGRSEAKAKTPLDAIRLVLDAVCQPRMPTVEAVGCGVHRISSSASKSAIFVVPAQEDLMIAVHVDRMARSHH